MQPPASPCVKVCELDPAGYCRGCWRTIDEIALWAGMTAQQQRTVLERVGERERRARAGETGQPSSES